MDLFEKLIKVNFFEFVSRSGKNSKTGWSGHGTGNVEIIKDNNNTVYFKEHGNFKLESSSQDIKISNEYVWHSINPQEISLSHARFGYANLVKLFDLIEVDNTYWRSKQEHVCVDDLYSADLRVLDNHIKLVWRIVGPKKGETIEYLYLF